MKYINIDLLFEQFPKAYEKLCEMLMISLEFLTCSKLQDFFEEKGLYIHMIPEIHFEGSNWNYDIRWIEKSHISGTGQYGDNGECNPRQRCNEYAIERCFYLYENYLKTGSFLLPEGTTKEFIEARKRNLQQDKHFNEYFHFEE